MRFQCLRVIRAEVFVEVNTMAKGFGIPRRAMLLSTLVLATAAMGLAQMGGMRGGYGGMVGSSLGGLMGGSLSDMMGGGTGLTIGTNGTLYITRSAQAQGQYSTSDHAIGSDRCQWECTVDLSNCYQQRLAAGSGQGRDALCDDVRLAELDV